MALNVDRTRQHLKTFDFKTLFIEELGWNHYNSQIEVALDGNSFNLAGVAEKHGMAAFICSPLADGRVPNYALRLKIEKQTAKSVHEHIIIYADTAKTTQIWQWVRREAGKPSACREHPYHINQPGDSLIQKLQAIAFSLEEEETLTIVEVAGRARAAFDVERITKKFYERFKTEHDAFLKFIEGIPDSELHKWYASVMLNRLMFIYFIQKKGFLDNDDEYLRNKLHQCRGEVPSPSEGGSRTAPTKFYHDFLCQLFFEGFAKKENDRSGAINKLLGNIPYLNGGLFLKHQIEELHGKHIEISDKAFEKLFDFFDQYQWHLDERPLRQDNEINPDVLGYIFEKYINQKQMGAYYTKEDITEYISKNTVIPFLFDAAKQKCRIAFEGETSLWKLLQSDPNSYFYPAVKKGVELPLPPEIKVGIKDVAKRTEWNKPASAEYALPTEIWREVVARRQRYEEVRGKILCGEIQTINDLITYNLDIRQFAQDVIVASEGPELLRAFYHAIENVTVLDPTCGSGAFLFAALNVLEPLYEACLGRMQVFVDELEMQDVFVGAGLVPAQIEGDQNAGNHKGLPLQKKPRSDKYSDFKKILKRASEHPNLKYFIYKSIIVNNLYGVDIMEEAIEICKLRLFLKLVAQIEGAEHMEPLPDIDFNIRAGNTLVGFATYDELKQTLQSDLVSLQSLPAVEEKAQEVDRLFRLFHQQQTELGGEVTGDDKLELRSRLKLLEDELNSHLANEYGVDPKKKTAYEKWLKSHQPFHWFIEFYGILKSGGFDVIIGNPPYVEYTKVKGEYTIRGYQSESCGNLYAYVMERSLSLVRYNAWIGLILPHSIAATYRSNDLQKILSKSLSGYYSFYSRRPGKLFEGADQCLCIAIGYRNNNQSNFWAASTTYQRWYSEERANLFEKLVYEVITDPSIWSEFSVIPKLGSITEVAILQKLLKQRPLSVIMRDSGADFYCHRIARYFIKATDFIPYFCSERDGVKRSDDFKLYFSDNSLFSLAVVGMLDSTLFYWFWRLMFDGYHCGRENIASFRFDPENANKSVISALDQLVQQLMDSFRKNSERKTVKYKGTGEVQYDEFTIKPCKPIIDEIDRVLAKHYGLTDEELDFIINYDIKYRMGRESGEEG